MIRLKPSLLLLLYVFMVLFSASFAVSPAWGQEVTATITRSVTDPSGAAVVGASVVAHDVERGTTYATQTNPDGVFNLRRMPVGTYEITVTSAGFRTRGHSSLARKPVSGAFRTPRGTTCFAWT